MEIITSILILLASGIISGAIFERFGLPDIVGQISSGVILGPAVLGFIQPTNSLFGISDIALFFIVLLLGLEVTSKTLTAHPAKSISLSFGSFILPVLIMLTISYFLFGLNLTPALIVSIGIGVPSISIVSVLLMHYSMLGTEDGDNLLSSVVISDILAFIILASIYNSLTSYGLLVLILTLAAFLAGILIIANILRRYHRLVSGFFERVARKRDGETAIFAIIILLGLLIASFLQFIGITFVLGAFFAGMLIEELIIGRRIFRILVRTFKRINTSFFIPLFFSIAGATTLLPNINYWFLLLILVMTSAGFSTIFISHIGRKSFKTIQSESAMSILGGRGAVGIIIANIALSGAFITVQLYSLIVFGTVVMSIVFPGFMRPKLKNMRMKKRRSG